MIPPSWCMNAAVAARRRHVDALDLKGFVSGYGGGHAPALLVTVGW